MIIIIQTNTNRQTQERGSQTKEKTSQDECVQPAQFNEYVREASESWNVWTTCDPNQTKINQHSFAKNPFIRFLFSVHIFIFGLSRVRSLTHDSLLLCTRFPFFRFEFEYTKIGKGRGGQKNIYIYVHTSFPFLNIYIFQVCVYTSFWNLFKIWRGNRKRHRRPGHHVDEDMALCFSLYFDFPHIFKNERKKTDEERTWPDLDTSWVRNFRLINYLQLAQ